MSSKNIDQEKRTLHEETREAPPRAPGFIWVLLAGILVVGALLVGVFAGPSLKELAAEFFSEKTEGKTGSGEHAGHAHGAQAASDSIEEELYTCPMHPWIVESEPGQCPICAMDLIPIEAEKFGSEIAIDPVVLQNIGVRVEPVVSAPLKMEIRTVGNVAYDETRIVDVNLKIDGWVEKIHVDSTGAQVKRGQPLFELYSPDLYATQQEYLLLWKNRENAGNAKLLESARTRLSLYDISDEQIRELEENGAASRTMTISSPSSGIVMEKNVNQGLHVTPGQTIYRIADLSRVWVLASLYEFQLPFVTEGQSATIELPYVPGEALRGRISYIYPYLDEGSREVRVRLEFDNHKGLLKPGMFADVSIGQPESTETILVSREAVIDTGERKVAIVSLGEGRFESRTVETGRKADGGKIEINSGLEPGENVVVSGQFLLDSESRMRESLAKLMRGKPAGEKPKREEMLLADNQPQLPEEAEASLARVLDDYLAIQELLYNDSLNGVSAKAVSMKSAFDSAVSMEIPTQPHFWHQRAEVGILEKKMQELAAAKDLDAARTAFGFVGKSLDDLLKATGLPKEYEGKIKGWRCGMYAPAPEKGIWLQAGNEAHNPFYGANSGMKSCHSANWDFATVLGK